MVKNLACYLTDHKQKSINSSWLEIAIWPQIWSLAPFILNVFKCPFKSLIWTPPHPHRPFSRREILNSAPKCIFWWLRAKKLFVHRNFFMLLDYCRTANNRRRSCPSWVPPQLFKQEVKMSRSRGQQLSMYLFEGGRGAVASTSAAPEQNELSRCQRNSLIKLTLISFCISTDKIKMLFWIEWPRAFHENI